MPASNRGLPILILVLGGGFLYGLLKLYDLRFSAGDIYQPYSSLRADPLGTKALYESLQQIPGVSATRNYLELPSLPKKEATVFFLGENPFLFEAAPEDEIKAFEALAAGGARVVIAMRPVSRPAEQSGADEKTAPRLSAIEKRWGIRFEYVKRPATQADDAAANPKLTALYFRVEGKMMHRVERLFGTGAIVLLASCYPLSNEALAGERDTQWVAWALGSNRQVVFDEHHLGSAESGGVVTLARKYRLEGVAATLLLLLALFIWKNSSSLLPPRREAVDVEETVAAKDVSSGLANLLRRNIPAKELLATCLEEWESSRRGGRYYPQAKVDRIRALARREGDAVETYRKMSRILSERSDA